MPTPFSYPPRPWDRALAAAGQAERLARAVVRRVRGEGFRGIGAAVRRGTVPPPGPHPPAPSPATPRPLPGRGGEQPVIYLPAVAWGYRFQRPQHLALALARGGHPLLYVDGFLRSRVFPSRLLSQVQEGVHVLRVRVPGRPDPYRGVISEPAAVAMAATIAAGLSPSGPPPAFVLVQLPFWAGLGRELSKQLGCPLVYDRIDLHTGFPGVPSEIEAVEAELIRGADLVLATAAALAERPRELGARVLFLPNAADLTTFSPQLRDGVRPAATQMGYVGALGPWFDSAALHHAAGAFPGWRFRLAGRVEAPEVAALSDLPNVELAGEIPFRAVPGFLAGLDVALVPFQDLPLTRAVDPVKLYEALAMGLPVVARRLPETERWSEPLVYLYETPEDFARQVRRAVAEDSAERRAERCRAAQSESWDRRAEDLLSALRSFGRSRVR